VSAASFEHALATQGIVASVEERGRLAVLIAPDPAHAASIVSERLSIAAAAAAHGFTHVALEIGIDTGTGGALARHDAVPAQADATFSGD
jgi:hypothetical protein